MNSIENRVVISTRPLSDDDTIKGSLIAKGITVLDFPMIDIGIAEFNDTIKYVFQHLKTFQWIVFTSKNGVDYFFRFYKDLKISVENMSSSKIAVIGEKTASEVLKNGFKPSLISKGNTAHDLLKELINGQINRNENVLLSLGELAGDTLNKGLSSFANVMRINVYKTFFVKNFSFEIIERIKSNQYGIIIFTSPSGFANFAKIIKSTNCSNKLRIACIGKTTEKEMLNQGYKPLFVSAKSDGFSFANEIEKYFTTK